MVHQQEWFAYERYVITSDRLSVSVASLGATVTSVCLDGRERTLGYATPDGYLQGTAYIGAVVGRYGNRIGKARFSLDGTEYRLTANENGNQLHGGPHAFDKRIWQADVLRGNAVRFTLLSPDGDNGYPGNLRAAVTYTVDGNGFGIDFEGDSDADTVYAPTTHIYWNLDGAAQILDTRLQMHANAFLPVNAENIPTGEMLPTAGAFDFSSPRRVGKDYDHCFILNGSPAARAAAGDVRMTLETDYPALQLYTGGMLTGLHGKNAGFALEPEYYPNSPNHPEFPSPILRKGVHFHKYVRYRFEKLTI